MDKNAIKKYAVWARRELISRVSQKALQYGISEKETVPASAASVNGVVLSAEEIKQRKALIEQINAKGYEQVMEEVAYTWFNRFIALRFMEVNGYLPSHVRVFTDEDNAFRPQIITEAINLELDGLDMDKVYAWKDANDNDSLFKYLIITQCNALSPILPRMFQRIADYTELLFPDNLLREGSAIQQMIELIPEDDWKDAVQIIGWLYQFYNIEPKAAVFAKNGKISKEEIPAATQLFTPDWIVRYMVENSLGRLWLEHLAASGEGYHYCYDENGNNVASGVVTPASVQKLKSNWKYYLDEAEQEPDVQAQLATIRKEYASMSPEQIKCIDPCAGSGHILAYMFDILVQIYEDYGYSAREAVRSIIAHNLYGLDIDDRAAQLAYFAVMMKARQYDRRFLVRKNEDGMPDVPQPHVYAICESNDINRGSLKYFGWSMDDIEKNTAHSQLIDLLDAMQDAKEYGSILNLKEYNWELLYRYVGTVDYSGQLDFDAGNLEDTRDKLWELVEIVATLTQKYDVTITNPPYMSVSATGHKLSSYVAKNYPNSKADLFAVFIERCRAMLKPNAYQGMITMHSWMFLSSFEKLRIKLQMVDTVNMVHLGARAFEEIGGEVVQTTSFVKRNSHLSKYIGTYCRLVNPVTQQGKENMYLAGENRYFAVQSDFSQIPGSPVVYWAPAQIFDAYRNTKLLEQIAKPRVGLQTSNNERFIRLWHEVDYSKMRFSVTCGEETVRTGGKWFPHNKGGEYRKWYGNNYNVVDYENDGFNIKQEKAENLRLGLIEKKNSQCWNSEFYFRESLTWSRISSTNFGIRYSPTGFVFDTAGTCIFADTHMLKYLLGLLTTKVVKEILLMLNPTLTFQTGDIANIPVIVDDNAEKVVSVVDNSVALSQKDWDAFEISWDFRKHSLVPTPQEWAEERNSQFANARIAKFSLLSWHFDQWAYECQYRFDSLKENEEELNRIFIDIYGLQGELNPEVEDKDVTVRLADKKRDIKSLISYAVGCMFGRYSLDVPGLAYAGGEWDDSKYTTFKADKDSIIPICDDEYFADDIVGRFIRFIEVVYGKDTLQENLRFIADALGGSGQPKDVIRNYFLNDFYADHLKVYQKRPIYWLFDSGKKNGFKALVYMHRYQPDTIARMRTDYVHEQQARYRTAIADLEQRIASASTAERVKLSKRLKTLQEQAAEIQGYEEKIHHLADQYIAIDLDDGVKKNYAIFGDVLSKIK